MTSQKTPVFTSHAPEPVGAYSQAIAWDKLVFLSGQIPLDPGTGTVVAESFEDQVRQVLRNLMAVLTAAGSSADRVLKVTVFLTDISKFPVVNTIYGEFFKHPFPARSVVEVSRLPKDVSIEVEAIAFSEK